MIFTAEVVEEGRLGVPLGIKTGGRRVPISSSRRGAATRSRASSPTCRVSPTSIAAPTRAGRRPASARRSPRSAPRSTPNVRQLLDEAIAAVQAVPTPLADAVVNHHDEALAAYEAVQRLRRAFTLDVASVLGVKLTFGGNDGD